MNRKNKAILLVIVSILILILEFKTFKDISDFFMKKYKGENLIKEKYEKEDYNFIVEKEHELNFLKANSLVKLGDYELKEQNKETAIKRYTAALDFYKLAIEQRDEINIKKNYEVTLNKIDQLKNQEQQEQQESQEQQNKKQDSKEQNESQDQKNDSEENKSNNSENKNEENESNQEQQQSKPNDAEADKNEQTGEVENSAVNTEEKISQQELQYILEKLEINEKQAFKNNERFINQNNEENSKKW